MSEYNSVTERDQNQKKTSVSASDLTQIAVFTAIITVISQISIPMPAGVPMTLQTLIIPVAGIVLGRKKGTYATLLYLLIGAVGLPVFSGFKGGPGVLFGMTGGFLISFPALSYTAGLFDSIAKKACSAPQKRGLLYYIYLVSGLIIGATINYVFGTVWFMLATGQGFLYSFTACVLPFIPVTLIKIAASAIIGPELKRRVSFIS